MVLEKKFKTDFQDGGYGGHLWFPIWTLLATFNLQVTSIFPSQFWVSWPFCSEEFKTDFQNGSHGNHLGFPIKKILAIVDLQVTLYLLYWQEKFKQDFEDRGQGGHLGLPLKTIIATFDLQVTLIFPTKFWPFRSEGEFRNRFSRWLPWRLSWISSRDYFSYFWLLAASILPIKFWVNWPFGSGEVKKRFSRWWPWQPPWISGQNYLNYSLDISYKVLSHLAFRFIKRSSK